jgi:tRNA nucleotidyltransferase/poly(A) polymerase
MVHMPAELARAARSVAEVLGAAGRRAWLVGGAVRDLALEVEPQDVDLASAARPEELERLFAATYAVGKAFGTVVVRSGSQDVQVTTFRAEAGYDDARRPSHVRFAEHLEEDAARRDFTCNALYLDPLSDELVDPAGGLADLGARRLRCVGVPGKRFAEDGLRLLRLARLAAQHGFAIEEETRAAACNSLEALRGLSPERVFAELQRMALGSAPARAVGLLQSLGVLERLPGLGTLDRHAARVEALARLERGGEACFFATLFRPGAPDLLEPALAGLWALRPPRALHQGVQRILELGIELGAFLDEFAHGRERRARWIRLVRAPEYEDAQAVFGAWNPARLARERELLRARTAGLTAAELWPPALVTSAELARAGIPRGPRWSALLHAAEELQLEGELRTPEEARAWLARRASE